MNLEQLRIELEQDEGCVAEIYLDHLGFPTFGIGHLVKKTDDEFGLPEGSAVAPERINECFEDDIQMTCDDCLRLYPDFDMLPEEVQLIIANMMFNLGATKMAKFRGMKSGVDDRDWQKAADEMKDSKWFEQVPNRAQRLIDRMRNV